MNYDRFRSADYYAEALQRESETPQGDASHNETPTEEQQP